MSSTLHRTYGNDYPTYALFHRWHLDLDAGSEDFGSVLGNDESHSTQPRGHLLAHGSTAHDEVERIAPQQERDLVQDRILMVRFLRVTLEIHKAKDSKIRFALEEQRSQHSLDRDLRIAEEL